MKIRLRIPILQALTNNEAFTYFCVLVSLANNPNSTIKDFIRLSGFGETTLFNHLKKFEEYGALNIDRSHNANYYSVPESSDYHIAIDSSLLEIPADRNVLGSLIRLKCWSRIASNIVDLSLNRIVHEISIQHSAIYSAMEAGLIERDEKKLFFQFIHPSLSLLG